MRLFLMSTHFALLFFVINRMSNFVNDFFFYYKEIFSMFSTAITTLQYRYMC